MLNTERDLFPGFEERTLAGDGVEIHCRIGGSGPPLLLLHGYPQTHAMWHPVAGDLARCFTVVIADLRGYGRSGAPEGDADHMLYSKRQMARDMIVVMRALGHERFAVAGHDRGGRVAYRMAFDHPDSVTRLAVLDILPTYDYWQNMDWRYAMAIYHWLFLAQPKPLPERLIAGAPDFYLDYTLASWTATKDLSAFDPDALAEYRASFRQEARQHAACEDYRAGATIDMDLDTRDREAGRRIACPLLVIYGAAGLAGKTATPLDTWSTWGDDVSGAPVDAGHFMVEENPAETLRVLLSFLCEGVC
ncbi:MAG: alpha/beta hydrolase [Stappia sp.]|uniref:alpha/beta fold hydrolase n=1 Tax=Stappia sp. TaxID=1870903 RepID=UPI000C626913|nr:alpha/beta hydrolase [Stappia sp.]MAA96870.1 alpha/beta hydrolase [Stappia sp.]MBM21178.1 alpha/beta hydrolase [Stappia sp.]